MKTRQLTVRQQQRRDRILDTARELIAVYGYDGVRMRELAERAGVSPKTLYDQYNSKENLLWVAVEEKLSDAYRAIDAAEIDTGIDRLNHIARSLSEAVVESPAYALALAKLLTTNAASEFADIATATYSKALAQIEMEGDLEPWIDIPSIASLLHQHVSQHYLAWAADQSLGAERARLVTLDLFLTVRAISTGNTHRRATEICQRAQATIRH